MELKRSEVAREFAKGCLELTGNGYKDSDAQMLMSYALAEKYDVLRHVLWAWLREGKGDDVWVIPEVSVLES